MHLGVCFKPDSLAMPLTLQGISYQLILLYLTVAAPAVCTFLCSHVIDPYIHRLVRRFRHSHHMHFIDPQPIGYTVHLWTAFVLLSQVTVSLSRLHRAFDKIGFSIMPIGVLGEAFRGVTPSFHFSDYQFYKTDCINSFLFYTFIFSFTPNLFC